MNVKVRSGIVHNESLRSLSESLRIPRHICCSHESHVSCFDFLTNTKPGSVRHFQSVNKSYLSATIAMSIISRTERSSGIIWLREWVTAQIHFRATAFSSSRRKVSPETFLRRSISIGFSGLGCSRPFVQVGPTSQQMFWAWATGHATWASPGSWLENHHQSRLFQQRQQDELSFDQTSRSTGRFKYCRTLSSGKSRLANFSLGCRIQVENPLWFRLKEFATVG